MAFLKSIFDGNEREIARLRRTVEKVNAFEPQFESLSGEELAEFRNRLRALLGTPVGANQRDTQTATRAGTNRNAR